MKMRSVLSLFAIGVAVLVAVSIQVSTVSANGTGGQIDITTANQSNFVGRTPNTSCA